MTIEIKSRFNNRVIHTSEKETFKEALLEALAAGTDLSGTNLRGTDLSGTNLSYANLSYANLRGTNLSGTNLSGTNLRGTNLSYANLSYANLRGTNLSGTNLSGTNLRGTNLSYANLSGTNLSGTNLRGTNLSGTNLSGTNLSGTNLRGTNLSGTNLSGTNLSAFKNDFFEILLNAPGEIAGLRLAIAEGRINGSVYEGVCACLVGTIAKLRSCKYTTLKGITPDGGRPAEQFFMSIKTGDTPETNQISKIVLEWIDEFTELASRFVKAEA